MMSAYRHDAGLEDGLEVHIRLQLGYWRFCRSAVSRSKTSGLGVRRYIASRPWPCALGLSRSSTTVEISAIVQDPALGPICGRRIATYKRCRS